MSTLTFCGIPLPVVFDARTRDSRVSLDWILNSGLCVQHSKASGLITLPSNNGVLSGSMNNVPVAADLPADLVLGLDWLQFVSNSHSGIVVLLSSGPLELRYPPLPAIGTNSEISSSSAGTFPFRWCSFQLFILIRILVYNTDMEPSSFPASSSTSSVPSPVSTGGGHGEVLSPQSTPHTRGVATASTLAAPPHTSYARCYRK
ncbi:hypothetical protein C8R45DRAFT_1090891 [Mycena sanguinolenta]|nr:hypothetical protein C8R45DRAFT_1090891 [Mycena sanguinolenta]